MSRFLFRGLILIVLSTLAIAKKNDHQSIEKVEIELDVFRGNAKITYNDEWKSKAEVLYAQKKKIVAYKDIQNGWCLLEKIEQRGLVNEEHYLRAFKIINGPLGKDQREKLAGKKILTFCAEHTSILLKPYQRDGRQGESKGEERVKREAYPLQGNESQISHQEASKKLLEDLTNAQSLSSSRTSHGKGLKRNADEKTENSRGHYPSSSAKVSHPPGIDYHTHVRNNIFPGTHAVHPIDITSSVTITTGSSHKIWSYPTSSVGYQNTTATSHPSGTSHLPHSSHQNISRDVSTHSVQHSLSLHHPYPSSLDQNQGRYSPSANSKSQQSPAIYPPSSTSKTQAPVHSSNPPSSASKNHHHPIYYPPSATSKPQQSPGYFAPSSSSTKSAPAHYPPSAATKTQGPSGYFPPSSSTKAQPPSYYLPSAAAKYQPRYGHYPPSSSSKTQGPADYSPSGTSNSQQIPANYPPSSFSKSQQGKTLYSLSSGTKPHHDHEHYPPSSVSKSQHYPPSATDKTHHTSGHYPPSSVSKTQQYPPSATDKTHHTSGHYPPSSVSKTQHYPPSATDKTHHTSGHYPPSSVSKTQHYPPSATDKTHHTSGHYPPSSVSKPIHDQYPPSSITKTHQLQQNITTGSPSGGGKHLFAASHLEQPTYVPPSSTSKTHYHPQNGTRFQYNTLYSYGAVPGMYAPQFPPSSTSKFNSPQQFPSSASNVNYVPQSENPGAHHHKHPHSFVQYPPSSTTKFHTKLDQSGGQTPHFPPSLTTKMSFPLSMHGSAAPVLEKPSAEGSSHEHGSYPASSSSKEHPGESDVSQFPPSSASKAYYVPSSGHIYGGTHQDHTHPPLGTKLTSTPPSGPPPSAQIPQPPVSGHFHSSLHMHSFPAQYYPPSISVKQSHNPPYSQTQQPVPYYPSSTAKLHPVPKKNVTKHLPPVYFPPSSVSKFQPSSVGHRHDFHSGLLTPAHVPYYPPSAHSKTLNRGAHYPPQHYLRYAPSSSSHYMRNESSIGPGKSSSPSPVGHTFYSHPQYPPSSSSRFHPNASENTYPSPAMPLYPSGGQYYPTHSPYNVTVSHHHQYQEPNIAPQPHEKPQFQQGSTKPCPGSLYSITTRTIVTPNGIIQRPFKNNGESPCGNVKQGTVPYTIPCGSIIKNGQSVKVQSPCMSNHPNQRKSMRNVLVPGPALMPGKRTPEQNEFGSSDGVIITNVGESEAEVLDGISYPVSHQQFSHLKENSTSEEVEDFEGEENQTKLAEDGEKEKVEGIKEETSAKRGEEEEVKEGDVLEPGDRILGKNGYTISDGFRGRVVSVSGQVAKTRTTKGEKKSNSAQFKYSSELGRYSKDDEEKRFSDCHGEVTFTCSEFLGSNGRAKICKPNPRRNPDGSPC